MAKDTAETKKNIIMIRLTDKDLEQMGAEAEAHSVPVATMIRMAVHAWLNGGSKWKELARNAQRERQRKYKE
jgi:predicted DNA binding CopG/RHH family protein